MFLPVKQQSRGSLPFKASAPPLKTAQRNVLILILSTKICKAMGLFVFPLRELEGHLFVPMLQTQESHTSSF